jgi:uncharacterized beta-barrel protein YwiB (DUF1934 family)
MTTQRFLHGLHFTIKGIARHHRYTNMNELMHHAREAESKFAEEAQFKGRTTGVEYSKVPLLCDNESAIKIAYNPVLHGKTKHIEIRNHFIRDHTARGDIVLSFIGIKEQLVDIFTKPLDEQRFIELRYELNIIDPLNFA